MPSSWSSSTGGGPPKTPFPQFHPVPAHPIILALSTCVPQPGLETSTEGKIKPTGCRVPFPQGAGASQLHQLSQNMTTGLMPHVTASLAPGFVKQHPWEEKLSAMPSYNIPDYNTIIEWFGLKGPQISSAATGYKAKQSGAQSAPENPLLNPLKNSLLWFLEKPDVAQICNAPPHPGTGPAPAAAPSQPWVDKEQQDLAGPGLLGTDPTLEGFMAQEGGMSLAGISQPWAQHIILGASNTLHRMVSQHWDTQCCDPSLLSLEYRAARTLLARLWSRFLHKK